MKNDTEIECYNKEIREITRKVDGVTENTNLDLDNIQDQVRRMEAEV